MIFLEPRTVYKDLSIKDKVVLWSHCGVSAVCIGYLLTLNPQEQKIATSAMLATIGFYSGVWKMANTRFNPDDRVGESRVVIVKGLSLNAVDKLDGIENTKLKSKYLADLIEADINKD